MLDVDRTALLVTSFLLVVFACGFSAYLIRSHLFNFTQPHVQSKIIGIIYMVPIYAFDSFLCLVWPSQALLIDMLRDCYEAYVLYLFLSLLMAYLGCNSDDDYEIVSYLATKLAKEDGDSNIMRGKLFLRRCKFGTLQYCVVRPCTALLAILFHSVGCYTEGSTSPTDAFLYLLLLNNLSVFYAFVSLMSFYHQLHHKLTPFQPVGKFLCIKFVIFFAFWQSVFLSAAASVGVLTDQESILLQNFLIVVEMAGVSVAHCYTFPYEPYLWAHHNNNNNNSSGFDHINNYNSNHRNNGNSIRGPQYMRAPVTDTLHQHSNNNNNRSGFFYNITNKNTTNAKSSTDTNSNNSKIREIGAEQLLSDDEDSSDEEAVLSPFSQLNSDNSNKNSNNKNSYNNNKSSTNNHDNTHHHNSGSGSSSTYKPVTFDVETLQPANSNTPSNQHHRSNSSNNNSNSSSHPYRPAHLYHNNNNHHHNNHNYNNYTGNAGASRNYSHISNNHGSGNNNPGLFTQGKRSLAQTLERHFAAGSAVRDFNESMPVIVLPTGFKASTGTVLRSDPQSRLGSLSNNNNTNNKDHHSYGRNQQRTQYTNNSKNGSNSTGNNSSNNDNANDSVHHSSVDNSTL